MVQVFIGHVAVKKCEKYAQELAEKYVSFRKDRYAVDDRLKSIKDGAEFYLSSTLAEWAAILYCGLDPNKVMNLHVVKGGDRGIDFILPDGRTVDVKSTNHFAASRLIWPQSKDINSIRASILIAAKCDLSTRKPLGQVVDLVGWVSSQEFKEKARVSDGHGGLRKETRFMYYKDLKTMDALKGESYANY